MRSSAEYLFRRILCFFLSLTLFFPPQLYAQFNGSLLPPPAVKIGLTQSFHPAVLNSIAIHPENPFIFDFIVSTGDIALSGQALSLESGRLIRYFMAALTVPESDIWVNLSPYEGSRMIPDHLKITELGRDLLAQDYVLKQLAASLTDPKDPLGARFWERIYKRSKEHFGTTDIPVNVFNKVWIVPDEARVYQHDNRASVSACHLKVQLAEDMVAAQGWSDGISADLKTSLAVDEAARMSVSARIEREIILPEIEREVNEGKLFAPLRQIFYSIVLASWFKKTSRNGLIGRVYADQNKVSGIDLSSPENAAEIYTRYVEAFRKGVYHVIQEDVEPSSGDIVPRKYFSGGIGIAAAGAAQLEVSLLAVDKAQADTLAQGLRVRIQALMIQAEGKSRTNVDAAEAVKKAVIVLPESLNTGWEQENDIDEPITHARDVHDVLRTLSDYRLASEIKLTLEDKIRASIELIGQYEAAKRVRNVVVIPPGYLPKGVEVVLYRQPLADFKIYVVSADPFSDPAFERRVIHTVLEGYFYYRIKENTWAEAQSKAAQAVKEIEALGFITDSLVQVKASAVAFQEEVQAKASEGELQNHYDTAVVQFRGILQRLQLMDPELKLHLKEGIKRALATAFETPGRWNEVPWMMAQLDLLQTLGLMRVFTWHSGVKDREGFGREVEKFALDFWGITPEMRALTYDQLLERLTKDAVRRIGEGKALAAVSHKPPDFDTNGASFTMSLLLQYFGIDAVHLLRGIADYPVHIVMAFRLILGIENIQATFPTYFPESFSMDAYVRMRSGGEMGRTSRMKFFLLDNPALQEKMRIDLLAAVIDHHELSREILDKARSIGIKYESIGSTTMKVGLMSLGLGLPLAEKAVIDVPASFVSAEFEQRKAVLPEKKLLAVMFENVGSKQWTLRVDYLNAMIEGFYSGRINEQQAEAFCAVWRRAYTSFPMEAVVTLVQATNQDDTNNADEHKLKMIDHFLMSAFEDKTQIKGSLLYWLFLTYRFLFNAKNPVAAVNEDYKEEAEWMIGTDRYSAGEIQVPRLMVMDDDGKINNQWWFAEVARSYRERFLREKDLYVIYSSIVGKEAGLDLLAGGSKQMIFLREDALKDRSGHLVKLLMLNLGRAQYLRMLSSFIKSPEIAVQIRGRLSQALAMIDLDFHNAVITLKGVMLNGKLILPRAGQIERKVAIGKLFRTIIDNGFYPVAEQMMVPYSQKKRFSIMNLGLEAPAEKEDFQMTLEPDYFFVLTHSDGIEHTHRVNQILKNADGIKTGFITVDDRRVLHRFRLLPGEHWSLREITSGGKVQSVKIQSIVFDEVRYALRKTPRAGAIFSDDGIRELSSLSLGENEGGFAERYTKASNEYYFLSENDPQALANENLAGAMQILKDVSSAGLTPEVLQRLSAVLRSGEKDGKRNSESLQRVIGQRGVDPTLDRDLNSVLARINGLTEAAGLYEGIELFLQYVDLHYYTDEHRALEHLVLLFILNRLALPQFPFHLEPLQDLELKTPDEIEGRIRQAYLRLSQELAANAAQAGEIKDSAQQIVTPGGIILDPRQINWAGEEKDFQQALTSAIPANGPPWDAASFQGFQLRILKMEPVTR